ncbi:leucine-rich repeat domain-containing protein [Spirosoma fluminis]
MQKGHITALNLSGHTLTNLQPISQLPYLSDLFLQNCGLSDMSSLRSERLDRLDVSNNRITDVTTLRDCPNLRWLFMQNNPLRKSRG